MKTREQINKEIKNELEKTYNIIQNLFDEGGIEYANEASIRPCDWVHHACHARMVENGDIIKGFPTLPEIREMLKK